MAANQVGKTLCAAAEVAIHLTGQYPDYWKGKRFDRATHWLAGSESGELTKKGVQRNLFGRDIETGLGTGMIPAKSIIGKTAGRGVAELIDTARIQHVSGGVSTISLKSYEQGRGKWQADTVDGIWFDEEPPLDIYTEGLTRTNTTLGPILMTLTPLLGMSDVVMRFMGEKTRVEGTHLTIMTIDDAEHYTPEQREAIIKSYPAFELEARTKGIPMLGSGRIFPIAEDSISEGRIEIPKHWPRLVGLDLGWDHPAGAVWMAWDRDTDCVHIYDCWRERQTTPMLQAPIIRSRGAWIPVAWPHDALQHDKGGSGEQLAKQYRDAGVNMLPERSTFEDGVSSGVEAGLMIMLERMESGRLKVASHLGDWWEEFRLYHRKDGKIVKERDDLMSATRYGIMMLRCAETQRAPRSTQHAAPSWLG